MAQTKKEKADSTFGREQLVSSKRYADVRDIVGAVLNDGQEYTIQEVDALIQTFMKGKVK